MSHPIAFLLALIAVDMVVLTAADHPVRQHLNALIDNSDKAVIKGIDLSKKVAPESRCHATHKRKSSSSGLGSLFQKSKAGSCVNCANQEECCGGESCCNNGQFCCANTTTCCSDTCCDNFSESCCPDPIHGGVCCIKEDTFCCAPNATFDHPSRCCPRWYVCCEFGRYGCCDPDTMLPMEANEGYSLFLEPTWLGPMVFRSATIDLRSGSRTEINVTGDFRTWGETPRSFMFDPTGNHFYLLQANFTGPKKKGDPERKLDLFAINPRTGVTVTTAISGAEDEITGYHFVTAKSVIFFSTYWYEEGEKVGYKYYSLAPSAITATMVASMRNPKGQDTYAGWFHEVSPDLSTVYRLGYEDVVESINFGVGVMDVSKVNASLKWISVSDPMNHGHYRSLNLLWKHPAATTDYAAVGDKGPLFLSLAPDNFNETRYGDLSLWLWYLNDGSLTKKLTTWSNAHTVPYFGPIAESISASQNHYAAVIVADSIWGSDSDTWNLAFADLVTGNSTEMVMTPEMIAVTVSVSGFGIPYNSTLWQHQSQKKHWGKKPPQ